MKVYKHYRHTGKEQRWAVPAGVTAARFECWGAGGGVASGLHYAGKVNEVVGGSAPANTFFYNGPSSETALGISYSNGSGYTAGDWPVNPGETYYVFVGGNGKPGYSSIKLNKSGTYTVAVRGGAGGYNGGGDGGQGAHTTQNLHNSHSTGVTYNRPTLPPAAKVNQLWYDTGTRLIQKCNTTYASGHADDRYWDRVTKYHADCVGPSGGGGGGATDIRQGDNDPAHRILVAGGAGGSAGHPTQDAPATWTFRQVPTTPKPPFGNDTAKTGHSGADETWATGTTYWTAGWGHGGAGGGSGPNPSHVPTINQGRASTGETGGVASARVGVDSTPLARSGSGGGPGGALTGGYAGNGGGAQAGILAYGGNGADAAPAHDDWCAGGGGGGGGYYGGGGGGMGFRNSGATTDGGGGGGGSSFVKAGFLNFVIAGAARPPMGYGNSGTGADGHGGFCRISYNQAPVVKWKSFPNSALLNSVMTAEFTYAPAVKEGVGISHYLIGTATSKTATTPVTTQTIMVPKSSTADFSITFAAPPTAGTTYSYFVQVVDTDGDASPWLKQTVTALSVTQTTAPTITSPAAGAQFVNFIAMAWTVGNQTPLAAYRTGVTGTDPVTGKTVTKRSAWHRGGSRINWAPDPGFKAATTWSSTSNTKLATTTTNPGLSGSSGRISWTPTLDGSAENHTIALDDLQPGYGYHLHLDVTSNITNDPHLYQLQVWDQDGLLDSQTVSLAGGTTGVFVGVDLHFVPHTQGVYAVFLPSSCGVADDVDPVIALDFEDGTAGGFGANGTNSADQSVSGSQSLKTTGTAAVDITALLPVAGTYQVVAQGYRPSTSATALSFHMTGTGVTGFITAAGVATTLDAWQQIQHPFVWDGIGTAIIDVTGDATTPHYWDDIYVYPVDPTEARFGNSDNSATSYLANMLIELSTVEDGDGYPTYFDGDNLNGNTGAVSWSGTAYASPSILTGTDVTSGTSPNYPEKRLTHGQVFVDMLSVAGALNGYAGAEATQSVSINPALPNTPTVGLQVNNQTGLMTLSVDAADTSATYKTVRFDIFRDGVRIATGLTPDDTTRLAQYIDAPATGYMATYVVRALDSAGGYVDVSTGAVTLVS